MGDEVTDERQALSVGFKADSVGWAWPSNASRAHYFVAGRSLCGQWAWPHDTGMSADPPTTPCARCSRKKEADRG